MKKLILLSIVFLSAQHVYADIECRIAREKPFEVNGEQVHAFITHFKDETQGRHTIFQDSNNVVEINIYQNKVAIYSSDSNSLRLHAMGVTESTNYLMVYDSENKQTIACERKAQQSPLKPRYIRSAAEGGSSPTPPTYSGCWIISCAY